MVEPILFGKNGSKTAADLDQATTGLIFAGQAIDLKAEDQADMPEGDFGQKPGEIITAGGAGAGAALIPTEHAGGLGGPTPGPRTPVASGLALSGFALALRVLRVPLAH